MNGHNKHHKKLLYDFLYWQTPYLLLLQNLADIDHEHIEEQARLQALIVDKQCHLHTMIINERIINAARVEAALRKSQPQHSQEDDNAMSTEYIELGITRTN